MGPLRARAAPRRAAASRRAAALARSLLLPLALLALLSPAAAFRASLRWAPCGSAWGAGVASRRAAGPPAPARCAASGGRSRVRLALHMAGDSREVRHASVLWGARGSRLRAAWQRAALQIPRERARRRLLIRASGGSSRRERRRGRRRLRAPARSSPRPSKTSSPAPSPSPAHPSRAPPPPAARAALRPLPPPSRPLPPVRRRDAAPGEDSLQALFRSKLSDDLAPPRPRRAAPLPPVLTGQASSLPSY